MCKKRRFFAANKVGDGNDEDGNDDKDNDEDDGLPSPSCSPR